MRATQVQHFQKFPVLQIRPNLLLAYDQIEWFIRPRRKDLESPMINFKGEKTYQGLINSASAKRLKRAVNLLVAASEWKTAMNFHTGQEFKFKVNFITLTLPAAQGEITDKEIKKQVLDVWLKMARRRFKLRSYVWRAERQKNGNIHFHITSDTFIWHNEIRDTWNDRCERLGLITAFEKKNGHRNPNSTDVHSVNSIQNLAGYMVKYMSKGDYSPEKLQHITALKFPPGSKAHKRAAAILEQVIINELYPMEGKVWDCSENLKQKIKCDMLLDDEARTVWDRASSDLFLKVKTHDQVTILPLTDREFRKYVTGQPLTMWKSYINQIQNYHADQLQNVPAKLEDAHSASDPVPF